MSLPRFALFFLNPWRLWRLRRTEQRQRVLDDRLLSSCMAYGHDAFEEAKNALAEGADPHAKLGGREATLQALIHGQTEVAELILADSPQQCGAFAHALLSAPDAPEFAIAPGLASLARAAPIEGWATPAMLWLSLERGADDAAMILLDALPIQRASQACSEMSPIPWAALAMAMGNPGSAKILIAREADHPDGADWLCTHALPLCLCALSSSRMRHPRSIAALPNAMRWLASPQAPLSPKDFELMQSWTRGLPDWDFGGSMEAFDADPALEASFFECAAQNSDGALGAFIRLGAPPSIVLNGATLCEDRIFRSTCPPSEEASTQHNTTKRL